MFLALLLPLASCDVSSPAANVTAAPAAATNAPSRAPTAAPAALALPASSSGDGDGGGRWWVWLAAGVGVVPSRRVPIAFGFVGPLRCSREDPQAAKRAPYLRRRNSRGSRSSRRSRQMTRQSSAGQLLAELNPFGSSAPPPKAPVGRGSSSSELLHDLERGRSVPRTLSKSVIDIGLSGRTVTVDTGTHVVTISPSKASNKVAPSTVYFGSPKQRAEKKEVNWELEDVSDLDGLKLTPKTQIREAEPA
ncbi:hypothetical protein JL721_9891 [Aureococcus anophagefferens]|nr:hypothetical protein JL721_9891 [Aureococcus anophagefferens]